MENIINTPVENVISRKPYQKPQVIQVNLIAKEAVLSTGCKTSGQAGPLNPQGGTGNCAPFGTCVTDGS